jgi:flagellar hook-basal body complex protein FliE
MTTPVAPTGMRIPGVDAPEGTPLRIGREAGLRPSTEATEATEGGSFAAVLEKTIDAASAKEREAVTRAEALAAGRTDDLHGTMIAMKEADISLKLVGNIRTKLLDAFHELWRTSV